LSQPITKASPASGVVAELDGRYCRWMSRFGDLTAIILRRLARVRTEMVGFEESRFAAGPTIIAANHRSLIDTALLRYSLPAKVRARTATVGARDFFAPSEQDRGVRWLGRWLLCRYIVGAYRVCLIGRGSDMGDGVPRIAELLRAGFHVILFPEGTRTRSGELGRFRHGVAHLARLTGAPVLPVWIEGTERVMPVGRPWLRSGTVRAIAGEPLVARPDEESSEFLARMRRAIEALGTKA
jgi:1-acyl-sn-glycerol-3-phosphate acyltransferase